MTTCVNGPDGDATTRKELYELVWATPMSQLAARFGMSDRGLAKLCARHDVPTPPRGYWARRRAGKSVRRRPLPRRNEESSPIQLVEQTARAPSMQATPPVSRDPDVASLLALAKSCGGVELERESAKHHRLVRKAHRELVRRLKPARHPFLHSDDRRRPVLAIDVRSEFVDRACQLFDGLIARFEALGCSWTTREEGRGPVTHVSVLGEDFTFRIRERFRQRPFDPAKGGQDRFAPRVVREPTGLLVIGRAHSAAVAETQSREDTAGRLDERIHRVVASTIKAVQQARDARKAAAIRAEERRLEMQAEEERRRVRQVEADRFRSLQAAADSLDRAESLRRFVVACRARLDAGGGAEPDVTAMRCLAWADTLIENLDPLARGAADALGAIYEGRFKVPAELLSPPHQAGSSHLFARSR